MGRKSEELPGRGLTAYGSVMKKVKVRETPSNLRQQAECREQRHRHFGEFMTLFLKIEAPLNTSEHMPDAWSTALSIQSPSRTLALRGRFTRLEQRPERIDDARMSGDEILDSQLFEMYIMTSNKSSMRPYNKIQAW